MTDTVTLPVFLGDLHLLLDAANQVVVERCQIWVEAYVGATSDAHRGTLAAEIARPIDADPQVVAQTLKMLAFLADGLHTYQAGGPTEAATAVVEAVQGFLVRDETLHLTEGQVGRLREILGALALRSSEIAQAANTRRAIRGVLPMFEDLEATVELRSSLSPWEAEVSGAFHLVPLASLRLRLDSGEPSEVYFQATEADLAAWITRLQRLQTALVRLKESVFVGELPHA